jgi:hypothetical protein
MYPKLFPNGRDGKSCPLHAQIGDQSPATGAACTVNLVTICYKKLKVDTAKGLKTSGQVITIEFQIICNAEDAHT